MTPMMKDALKNESILWTDSYEYRKISTYFPFLISKAKAQAWQTEYVDGITFYKYRRVSTSMGFTFLTSVDNHTIVLSQAYGNYVGSSAFIAHFGHVIRSSSMMFSIMSPAVMANYFPDGPNLHKAVNHTATPVHDFVGAFRVAAYDNSIPDYDIDNLIDQISTVVSKTKLNKTLDDFQGLITQKDYDHAITDYAKTTHKVFFVTKGPRRGSLLVIGGQDGRWLHGMPVFTANKPPKDVVYGDYEEPEMSDSLLTMAKKTTSQCLVAEHQGFFVGVTES